MSLIGASKRIVKMEMHSLDNSHTITHKEWICHIMKTFHSCLFKTENWLIEDRKSPEVLLRLPEHKKGTIIIDDSCWRC